MRAARITAPREPLEVSDVPDPRPSGDEVLVRVRSVGVCHSDLHLWEGGYDMGGGSFMKAADRGVSYPVTPGHEVAGTVEEAPASSGYGRGDEVLVYPWAGCGGCPGCAAGTENLCDAPRSLGVFRDGGYAEMLLVPHHRYLVRAEGLDPDSATSLACSGLTAYTAVRKAASGSPSSVAIVGAGGLGLMGVQLAKELTGARVVCADIDDAKLEAARAAGADAVVNTGRPGAAAAVSEACGGAGADCVIDFVNMPATAGLGLEVLRKRGRLVLVGLFGGSVELPLVTVPLRALSIEGAYTGSYADMEGLVGLARRGAVRQVVSARYGLADAGSALEDLKGRRIVGRAVINP